MFFVKGFNVFFIKGFNVFFINEVSGLVENFNIEIYLDTINAMNVKLCMMVLLIELYLFIPLSVTLTVFQGQAISNTFN